MNVAAVTDRRYSKPRKKPSEPWLPRYVTKDYYDLCMKDMPAGALKANLSRHAPHNSYTPPFWYVDLAYKCAGCGRDWKFTAREQKYWYEVLKIPIYVTPDRCAACRGKRRNEIAAQKRHMEQMAKRPRHPNEAFFKKKPTR